MDQPLVVEFLELYPKSNSEKHRTDEYDLVNAEQPTAVFRRGCSFLFNMRLNREWIKEKDVIRVGFGCGPKPNFVQGTKAVCLLHPKHHASDDEPLKWTILSVKQSELDVQLEVRIPPNVPVGIWNLWIETNFKGDRQVKNEYKHQDDIYIVFNPWCPDDGVYMENVKDLDEYILNENGKIWCGSFKAPEGKPWIFGQFDEVCLPACVFLLEKSGLAHADRSSPVLVSRAISAVVNSVDDGGLLEGRWDGKYEDGTSPHAWTGSATIMEQFLLTGGESVKYGQCWVFSAAIVTVCRALGIPCRSVTNYVSAHDTNCSLTVDKYFDLSGNKIENGPEGDCNDSCWNFHVWNDVWMARPDLPAGYGGWQIIDATPQELSGGQFKCGPASVEAVRKGEVGYVYDTPFVFSEVNADIIHFQEDPESDWGFKRTSVNKYHVGKKIITKKIGVLDNEGNSDLWDVTRMYKNKEGSEAERLAMYNAARGVTKAHSIYHIPNKDQEDVFFDLIDIDTIPFGQNFDVVVQIKNNATAPRSLTAVLTAASVYYNGSAANSIKKSVGTFTVKPQDEQVVRITITPEEYLNKLVDHSLIKIYALANVHETRQTWSEEDDFTLVKPEVTIKSPDTCKVAEQCSVDLSFKNPLSMLLTQCSYEVQGPGVQKAKKKTFRDVQPNEVVTITEVFQAKKAGARNIVVSFTSKEIQGIAGSKKITIVA